MFLEKIKIEGSREKLTDVLSFVDSQLETAMCPMKAQMKIDIAVEEIFINIASYAYGDNVGEAEIIVDVDQQQSKAVVTFIDSGVPYNPLEKDDPDVSLSADEREIGGLGIFLVKKSMDSVEYRNEEGKNILTISYSWA